jgi:hypothetical protein
VARCSFHHLTGLGRDWLYMHSLTQRFSDDNCPELPFFQDWSGRHLQAISYKLVACRHSPSPGGPM